MLGVTMVLHLPVLTVTTKDKIGGRAVDMGRA